MGKLSFAALVLFIALCASLQLRGRTPARAQIQAKTQTQTQTYLVSGEIRDTLGQPVPFASIYAEKSGKGVTANEQGEYVLRLPAGSQRLVFSSIGYRQERREFRLDRNRRLHVVLRPEALHLETVQVLASAEDPAYAIIRQAIRRRKEHLEAERDYSAKVYVKSLQRVEEAPEKFLGYDVGSALELDSGRRGIVYLSESESELFVQDRDTYREVVYSSKVAGDNNGFSFNQASDLLFSFYQNLLLDKLNQRGFVSPIADNALFYYRYRLEGSFTEHGMTVHKIAVIPRRAHDPVFRGNIYIAEDQWRIHSLDLTVSREAQLPFMDSLNIRQSFLPAGEDRWMPGSTRLQYALKVLKFRFSGYFLAVFSDYRIPRRMKKGFYTNEIIKVEEGANKKDLSYWAKARPVPLTAEELRGYRRKDSLEVLKRSEHYLDSLDAENNRFTFGKLVFPGYTASDRYHKVRHSLTPLLLGTGFNTVEGAVIDMGYTFRKELEDKRSWSVSPGLRYGFSSRQLHATMGIGYRFDPLRLGSVSLRGGTDVVDFNERSPVSPLVNTIYTLALGRNLKKLYGKRFLEITAGEEVANGLRLSSGLEYARRLPLLNRNYYSFRKEADRRFTANDPLTETGNGPAFAAHNALTWEMQAHVVFGQRYKSLPARRRRLGSPYPELRLSYRKGLPWGGAAPDYDLLAANLQDRTLRMGLFGNASLSLGTGIFLNRNRLYYMDMHTFQGASDIYSALGFDRFYLLDNYAAFSADRFLEGHFEYQMEGFLLNKVPLLRKLKLNEIAGLNYLHTETLPHYWELFLGVQKIGLKAGWALSRGPGGAVRNGFRIGLGF